MKPFDPAKVFQQLREDNQQQREAAAEWGRQKSEAWAAYCQCSAALCQLLQIFPSDPAGATVDVARATALMIEYAQTLSREWVKARVAFVSERLAKLVADGFAVLDASVKEILLHLLLLAREGDHDNVAAIFTEALRDHPDDVATFRRCLVNWLMDKVVDESPPLPDEVIPPVEAPAESQDGQEPVDQGAAPMDNVVRDAAGTGPETARLHFDPQTQTVTLDGKRHKIKDPKAFSLYQEITSSCPNPLTKAILQERVPGCRGDKKIRQLLNDLPKRLCVTVRSGPNGYWLDLHPPSNRGRRSRRQKGRT